MNKRQANRLLNVARALRELPHPERFTMGTYLHTADDVNYGDVEPNWCGTPGCAIGTYASRPDLQRLITVEFKTETVYDEKTDTHVEVRDPTLMFTSNGDRYGFDHTDEQVQEHFGITYDETDLLFDGDGCGNAQTALEAAAFIEKFVASKYIDDEAVIGKILFNALNYKAVR